MIQGSGGMEVEQKFRLANRETFERELVEFGGKLQGEKDEIDTYLRHPARDFGQTDEAFRIRQVGEEFVVTYKGPRLASTVKIRPEIEIPLAANTHDLWMQVFQSLSFTPVTQVRKNRRSYQLDFQDRAFTITLDRVAGIGDFAEVELLIPDASQAQAAADSIEALARHLKLGDVERKSYLALVRASQKIDSAT